MGSTRCRSMRCVLILLGCITVASMCLGYEARPMFFKNKDEVSEWADAAFTGFRLHKFTRDGADVIVVIGMPSHGFLTSEVHIFRKFRGKYERFITRERDEGMVEVEETDNGLVFQMTEVLLVVPWAGLRYNRPTNVETQESLKPTSDSGATRQGWSKGSGGCSDAVAGE